MCGILLVKSQHPIPIDQHLSAFQQLKSRGPDFSRYQYKNNIFIGQTVLHITGTDEYYNTKHQNFLAYNGEIYNYHHLGSYTNDIEFIHDAVEKDLSLLKQGWGPWAWAWTDGTIVKYASDPQGEKCLYQYQDDNLLIVCSEVSPILEYINGTKIDFPYVNKLWTIHDSTPYHGVIRITPGQLYQNGHKIKNIDNIWDWVEQSAYSNIDEAYEEFKHRWQQVTKLMTPNCPAALTYSGGLDSSIILSHINNLELYAVNNTGKDPIVDHIRDFLTNDETARLHELVINPEQWAEEFCQLIDRTCLPAQSWSHIGQWLVAKNCQQRVLFSGTGADELFGGYDIYRALEFTINHPTSPYSINGDLSIWTKCLSVYNNDPKQATLLMDYIYQVAGCDARGVDVIGGAWGIESRNPFMAKPIIQLALNLPFDFKVANVSKPLIRRLFLERWPDNLIFPKKGFTGHANDSLPFLPITIKSTGDRHLDWKQISYQMFYNRNSV